MRCLRDNLTRALTLAFLSMPQNFVAFDEFCIRVCKDGPNAPALCQHIYDVMGCDWNMPGNYAPGSFDSCKGDTGEVCTPYPPPYPYRCEEPTDCMRAAHGCLRYLNLVPGPEPYPLRAPSARDVVVRPHQHHREWPRRLHNELWGVRVRQWQHRVQVRLLCGTYTSHASSPDLQFATASLTHGLVFL